MSKSEIQERIWDLREKASKLTGEERQRIQEEIKRLQKELDS